MAYYWFTKNIPELQKVEPVNRRGWLDVAMDRSRSKRAAMVGRMVTAIIVFVVIVFSDRWHISALATAAYFLFAVVADFLWRIHRQKRARQWLRENLHEFRVDEPATPASQP